MTFILSGIRLFKLQSRILISVCSKFSVHTANEIILEYEETESSKRKTPGSGTGRSSKPESRENSFRSPLSNRKSGQGSPERSRANSNQTSASQAVNHSNTQNPQFSHPKQSNHRVHGQQNARLDDRMILASIVKIQRAWRRVLKYRGHQAFDSHNFGGSYHTGSFSAKGRDSASKRSTPTKKLSKRTGGSANENTEQRISCA